MQTLPVPEIAGLTPKQQAALRLLAQGETVSATAAQTGVDRKTIYNWLETGTRFTYCLDALLESLNQKWADGLNVATQNALTLLNDLIVDPEALPSLRLKAALAVLNRDQKGGWPRSIAEAALSARNRSSFRELTETPDEESIGVNQRSSASPNEVPEIPQNSTLSPKTPRSAPCPCNSGEKYKRCCGKDAPPVLDAA